MSLQIPLQAVPSQTVAVQLNGQNCNLNIYQGSVGGLFMDVYSSGSLVIAGVICQNANPIVRDAYFGFSGDFVFLDNSGAAQDPYYTGLGTTYSLIYLMPADLAAYGLAA